MTFVFQVILPCLCFVGVLWFLVSLLPEDTSLTNDFSGIPPLDKEYEKILDYHRKMRAERKNRKIKEG